MAKTILAMLALAGVALSGCAGSTTTAATEPLHKQLHGFYSEQPYKAAGTSNANVPGGTPDHEWRTLPDGRLGFLHWDTSEVGGDVSKATKLLFVGDAMPGQGCLGAAGITQAEIDQGYNHFHKLHADSFAAGHHMDPANKNAQGYWLRHLDANTGAIFLGLDSTKLGASNPLKAC